MKPRTREAPAAAGPARIDWYDVPRLYDIVFDVGTRAEADFLEACARRYGRSRGQRALEPACGSGRLVAELVRRGWTVRGFDRNAHMLAYARQRLARAGLVATVVRGDLADFRVPRRVDLAHCLVSTFKYLLDEQSARSHLECTAEALLPGGIYVLGLHLTTYRRTTDERERWVETRGGVTVTSDMRVGRPDRRTRLEPVVTRITEDAGGVRRHYESTWDFRTYSAAELRTLIAAVPALELVALHDFDHDLAQRSTWTDGRLDKIVVLRRR
ncbi:MAG: class I SAM-dependent methyltransferase [Planctomycetes bacterium]|nr:class I SAM-dependent methyltransferase [Planctomycetota bacterium]